MPSGRPLRPPRQRREGTGSPFPLGRRSARDSFLRRRQGRCRWLQVDSYRSQITDVEITFRESVFIRSKGPQLLNCVSSVDPTAGVRGSFTPALGLRIAARVPRHIEGTGGVYLCEDGDCERVFLDGAFSTPGDSGSIIAEGNSRIVGFPIGGAGQNDVTYALPYYWIEERIKEAFANAHIYLT